MTRPENTPALEAEQSESGAVSVAPTYHGRPCKLGHTLRRVSNRHCVECNRDQARERMYRRRLDHQTYYRTLLDNRRRAALKAKEKRHGSLSDQG